MGVRRQAREIAVQILYSLEFRDDFDFIEDIFTLPEVEPLYKSTSTAVKNYASLLVQGVTAQKSIIDRYLSMSSLNWSIYRMARVDRAILRIGAYEMLAACDVPPYVAIDEALEVSKLYSSDEAPMYINGVLDRVSVLLHSEGLISTEPKVTLKETDPEMKKVAIRK